MKNYNFLAYKIEKMFFQHKHFFFHVSFDALKFLDQNVFWYSWLDYSTIGLGV
jgi:hypothetical protein